MSPSGWADISQFLNNHKKRFETVVAESISVISLLWVKNLGLLEGYSGRQLWLADLAQILDPRFSSGFIHSKYVVQKFVNFPITITACAANSEDERRMTLLEDLLDEISADSFSNHKLILFFRATFDRDMTIEPLVWWKNNANQFSNNAKLTRNVLALQSFVAAVEHQISSADNLITHKRSMLSDETIVSIMCWCS